jgi:hypothetical protein
MLLQTSNQRTWQKKYISTEILKPQPSDTSLKNNPTLQLSQVDTKPEILSAEKLKSRVDQQKETMKKLVDLRILIDEKKATVSEIAEQGFDMDDYWKIAKLFTILDSLDTKDRNKLIENLARFTNILLFTNVWNTNTAKLMKFMIDNDIMFDSEITYKNIKDQIQMID